LMKEIGIQHDYLIWITPDFRREDLVETKSGKCLPQLTLIARGYRLELSVQKSRIPNAGNGVFLSCTRVMSDDDDAPPEPFVLAPGELLDLGIYAPFRPDDIKLEAVLIVKNFLHSHKCVEWAFDAIDKRYHMDITDDVTGNLHTEAMKHIHAYVNESDTDCDVCIRAEHDAEGSVHYLLGHAYNTHGRFVLPSDGTQREVYVNYGPGYEEVRVRKGYCFQPDKMAHYKELIQHEDIDDVESMDDFTSVEVEACVNFFTRVLLMAAEFKEETILRALTVMVVLWRRARNLILEEIGRNKDDDNASVGLSSAVNLKKEYARSGALVAKLLEMMPDEEGELAKLCACGNVDRVYARVLQMQFSDEEVSELTKAMK